MVRTIRGLVCQLPSLNTAFSDVRQMKTECETVRRGNFLVNSSSQYNTSAFVHKCWPRKIEHHGVTCQSFLNQTAKIKSWQPNLRYCQGKSGSGSEIFCDYLRTCLLQSRAYSQRAHSYVGAISPVFKLHLTPH